MHTNQTLNNQEKSPPQVSLPLFLGSEEEHASVHLPLTPLSQTSTLTDLSDQEPTMVPIVSTSLKRKRLKFDCVEVPKRNYSARYRPSLQNTISANSSLMNNNADRDKESLELPVHSITEERFDAEFSVNHDHHQAHTVLVLDAPRAPTGCGQAVHLMDSARTMEGCTLSSIRDGRTTVSPQPTPEVVATDILNDRESCRENAGTKTRKAVVPNNEENDNDALNDDATGGVHEDNVNVPQPDASTNQDKSKQKMVSPGQSALALSGSHTPRTVIQYSQKQTEGIGSTSDETRRSQTRLHEQTTSILTESRTAKRRKLMHGNPTRMRSYISTHSQLHRPEGQLEHLQHQPADTRTSNIEAWRETVLSTTAQADNGITQPRNSLGLVMDQESCSLPDQIEHPSDPSTRRENSPSKEKKVNKEKTGDSTQRRKPVTRGGKGRASSHFSSDHYENGNTLVNALNNASNANDTPPRRRLKPKEQRSNTTVDTRGKQDIRPESMQTNPDSETTEIQGSQLAAFESRLAAIETQVNSVQSVIDNKVIDQLADAVFLRFNNKLNRSVVPTVQPYVVHSSPLVVDASYNRLPPPEPYNYQRRYGNNQPYPQPARPSEYPSPLQIPPGPRAELYPRPRFNPRTEYNNRLGSSSRYTSQRFSHSNRSGYGHQFIPRSSAPYRNSPKRPERFHPNGTNRVPGYSNEHRLRSPSPRHQYNHDSDIDRHKPQSYSQAGTSKSVPDPRLFDTKDRSMYENRPAPISPVDEDCESYHQRHSDHSEGAPNNVHSEDKGLTSDWEDGYDQNEGHDTIAARPQAAANTGPYLADEALINPWR
ncbi:hypothetical protein AMATHDRAFT_44732 [Amanita thiersii Skay4041]|uniref:Uncharacterized protein n=1 Tax=Amanita thiersii Skay4041 TaxID=703135 RepID=A0A2A9P0Y6_9AGAR|nr:hypothetical protein AMATHDRAFT_44732 [Amanita thiersii Skay4041]